MKPGRKRREEAVSVATNVRMTPAERARYTAIANAAHMTLSQWIREACMHAAGVTPLPLEGG